MADEANEFYMMVWPDPKAEMWDKINPASDPDTVRFVWKFGDGNSKNEHRYKAKGIKELLKNSTKVMFGQETLADWSEKIHKNDYDQDAAWAGSKGKISKMAAVRLTEAHGHIVKRIQDSQAGKVAEIRVLESLGSAQGHGETHAFAYSGQGVRNTYHQGLLQLLQEIQDVDSDEAYIDFLEDVADVMLTGSVSKK